MSAPESLVALLARVHGEHGMTLTHLRVACWGCDWSSDQPMPHAAHRTHVASVQAAEVEAWLATRVVDVGAVEALHQSSAETRGVGRHQDGQWTPYCEHDKHAWPCPTAALLPAAATRSES